MDPGMTEMTSVGNPSATAELLAGSEGPAELPGDAWVLGDAESEGEEEADGDAAADGDSVVAASVEAARIII